MSRMAIDRETGSDGSGMRTRSGRHARRDARVRPGAVRLRAALVLAGLAGVVAVRVDELPPLLPLLPDDAPVAVATSESGVRTTATSLTWTTQDRARFRLAVLPARRVDGRSPSGCLVPSGSDQSLVGFRFRLTNLGSSAAATPRFDVGVNLSSRGMVRPTAITLERSSRRVEIGSPPGGDSAGRDCAKAAGFAGGSRLAAGESREVPGFVGPVAAGAAGTSGLTLVVRYRVARPGSGTGSSPNEFLVPLSVRG